MKKAYLVTFTITTRIICEDGEDPIIIAVTAIRDKGPEFIADLSENSHLATEDDTEMPYSEEDEFNHVPMFPKTSHNA